jgi:SPP1 gp7 family putative phage head morphogenesis protein
VDELIRKIYEHKVNAGDLDADTWKATTSEYWKAIKEGWENMPKYFSSGQIAMLELRRNVNTFAAFKNHANIIEFAQALTDGDGKTRSFSEFKKATKAIDEKYNVNWLQAEYNLAVNSAKSAGQWQRFKEKGGKLEYKTVGDGRVRDEHRRLEGTILPVDHPFWNLYYPPNGWNCRCFVRHRPEDTNDVAPQSIPDLQPMFKNNVGATSQIFTNDHPFISEIGQRSAEMIRQQAELETRRWERKFIGDLLRDNLVDKTTKVDIDGFKADINYTARKLSKAVSQPHADQLDKTRALLNVEQLMKSSHFVKTVPNHADYKTQVKQYHYLLTEVAGKPSYIVLEELNDGTIYFHSIVDRLKS